MIKNAISLLDLLGSSELPTFGLHDGKILLRMQIETGLHRSADHGDILKRITPWVLLEPWHTTQENA